jgi:hypothetical protein
MQAIAQDVDKSCDTMQNGQGRSARVGSRVKPEQREWLEREAKRRERSVSYLVWKMVEEGIERRESSDSTQ